LRILNSSEVLQDSIMQTGVCEQCNDKSCIQCRQGLLERDGLDVDPFSGIKDAEQLNVEKVDFESCFRRNNWGKHTCKTNRKMRYQGVV